MADEAKPKRPVPPQFLKKKKEKEEALLKSESEQLPDPPAEIFIPVVLVQDEKKDVDIDSLTRDLMHNRYFHIFEKEARPIAQRMASEGFETLHEVKWFLALSERIQLAKELKEKHGLLK